MTFLTDLSSGRFPSVSINRETLDYRELVPIEEGLSGVTNSTSKYPIIGTMDVYDCIAGLGWFPDYGVAFSFHIASPFNVKWQQVENERNGSRNLLYPLFDRLEKAVWLLNPDAQAELNLVGGVRGPHSGFCYTTAANLECLGKALEQRKGITVKSATLVTDIRAAAIDSRNGRISTTGHRLQRGYADYFSKAYDNTFDGVKEYFGEGGIMPAEIQFDGTLLKHQFSPEELKARPRVR